MRSPAATSRFRGSQGTSIIGLFGARAAWTGANEKTLNRIGERRARVALKKSESAGDNRISGCMKF
jgi:hypothetical protein